MGKALVTGGSGFFGEILADHLISQGWDVFNLDLNPSPKISLEKQFIGDIRDLKLCEAATHGMDVVFHNVAQVPLAKNNELFLSVNVGGTDNILQAAYKSNVSDFVYTSTSAVFGLPQRLPIQTNSIPAPIEKYGNAKLQGENLCRSYFNSEMNIKIIRPRTILGAGRMGIFALLFKWVEAGVDIFLLGQGKGGYQFVHPTDLAEGIIRSVNTPGDQIFNLGALVFDGFKSDLENLCIYARTGSKVRSLPDSIFRPFLKALSKMKLLPFAPYQMLLYGKPMYFDSHPDWKKLGYTPRYSNIECLTTGYDWYLSNKNLVLGSTSTHKSSIKSSSVDLLTLILKYIKRASCGG
jgi:nucleoside-diphosphate-sugar epimerase